MLDRSLAQILLKEAATYYDAPDSQLALAAPTAAKHGFTSAGAWMHIALGKIRNEPLPVREIPFQWLGIIKYALALSAALIFGAVIYCGEILWGLPLMFVVFYAVEAQLVFLFPLAIDGNPHDLKANRTWVARAGGTIAVMKTVVPIAANMLSGGLRGKGFLRSWCLGCLAVLLWYEKLRNEKTSAAPRRQQLEIGATRPLQVRKEALRLNETSHACRLMYASDLHFKGKGSERVAGQLINAATDCQPDVILLGGDLADAKSGLPLLSRTIQSLARIAPVAAIAGNHDSFVGLAAVQRAIETGGGQWLEQSSIIIGNARSRSFIVDGNIAQKSSGTTRRILCAHDPNIFPLAVEYDYALVLAGHLHGGQLVLTERSGRLYPAAWFYRWNGLSFTEKNTTMLVSRGVSDTLPIRWNCPREILLCELY